MYIFQNVNKTVILIERNGIIIVYEIKSQTTDWYFLSHNKCIMYMIMKNYNFKRLLFQIN